MLLFIFANSGGCSLVPWSHHKSVEKGIASWYGPDYQGRRTASGEIFEQDAMTAAHRTLPFGTVVLVKDLDNGRTVRVRINDRGPFIHGRIIDLSRGAARELGMLQAGLAHVRIEVIHWGDG
jgi:rare lipoprotein A